MRLRLPLGGLGYVAAALPLVTIHLCYLVAAAQGYVDWCVPYGWDCTSISKTGREGVAYFLFKGGIIPTCVLLGLFWHLTYFWLQSLGQAGHATLPWLGWAASVSLLIYTLVLGHDGDSYRMLRRFGVVLYLALTFIAQVLLARALTGLPALRRAGRLSLAGSQLMLAVAVASLLIDFGWDRFHNRIENGVEWVLVVALNVQLLWLAHQWRISGFQTVFESAGVAVQAKRAESPWRSGERH